MKTPKNMDEFITSKLKIIHQFKHLDRVWAVSFAIGTEGLAVYDKITNTPLFTYSFWDHEAADEFARRFLNIVGDELLVSVTNIELVDGPKPKPKFNDDQTRDIEDLELEMWDDLSNPEFVVARKKDK